MVHNGTCSRDLLQGLVARTCPHLCAEPAENISVLGFVDNDDMILTIVSLGPVCMHVAP